MAENILFGDHPLAYGSYLYDKNMSGNQYSVARAKQTLQNSGWNFANKTWQKKEGYNTIRLRINLLVQASNENRLKVAEIIKKNLEEARNTSNDKSSKGLEL